MDDGKRPTGLVDERISREKGCRSCAIAQGVAGDGTLGEGSYIAEDIDENVVVVGGTELDGLVVVPRQHIAGLEELPVSRQAQVLAALQRARRTVSERHPGVTTSIVVMTDPPASAGHTWFHVRPAVSEGPARSLSMPF